MVMHRDVYPHETALTEAVVRAFDESAEDDTSLGRAIASARERTDTTAATSGRRRLARLTIPVAAAVVCVAAVVVGAILVGSDTTPASAEVVLRALARLESAPPTGSVIYQERRVVWYDIQTGRATETVKSWRTWDGSASRTESSRVDRPRSPGSLDWLPDGATVRFAHGRSVQVLNDGHQVIADVSVKDTPLFDHGLLALKCQDCHSTHYATGSYELNPAVKSAAVSDQPAAVIRGALRSGQIEFGRPKTTVQNGVKMYLLEHVEPWQRVLGGDQPGLPRGGNMRTELHLVVRADDYTVVRMEERTVLKPDGKPTVIGTSQSVSLEARRALSPSSLPAGFFQPRLPEGPFTLQASIPTTLAPRFREFPLYWIGPRLADTAGLPMAPDDSGNLAPLKDPVFAQDFGVGPEGFDDPARERHLPLNAFPTHTEASVGYAVTEGVDPSLTVRTYSRLSDTRMLALTFPTGLPVGRLRSGMLGGRPVTWVEVEAADAPGRWVRQAVFVRMPDATVAISGFADPDFRVTARLVTRLVRANPERPPTH
jgi:hypothetical protein